MCPEPRTEALEIGGESYDLLAVHVDYRRGKGAKSEWCYQLTKHSGGAKYTVWLDPARCTCPAYEYRPERRPCKHILAIGRHLMSKTATKEKAEEAEFTATAAPTNNLPAPAPATPFVPGAALGQLAAGLEQARRKCQPVEKDSTNSYHKYRYASAEAVIEAAKDALDGSGVVVIPLEASIDGHEQKGLNRYELRRKFMILHTSGQYLVSSCHWPVVEDKGRPLDKAAAIADTLSYSYFLRDLLNMPRVNPEDDAAGRDDTRPAAPAKTPAVNGPQKPSPAPARSPEDPTGQKQQQAGEPRIGEQDLAELQRLVREHNPDVKALLAHFKVKALAQLAASQYQPAVKWVVGRLPLTADQKARIDDLVTYLKVPALTVKQRLHDLYRVENVSQLAQVQASDMIDRLEKSAAVKRAPVPAAGAAE